MSPTCIDACGYPQMYVHIPMSTMVDLQEPQETLAHRFCAFDSWLGMDGLDHLFDRKMRWTALEDCEHLLKDAAWEWREMFSTSYPILHTDVCRDGICMYIQFAHVSILSHSLHVLHCPNIRYNVYNILQYIYIYICCRLLPCNIVAFSGFADEDLGYEDLERRHGSPLPEVPWMLLLNGTHSTIL